MDASPKAYNTPCEFVKTLLRLCIPLRMIWARLQPGQVELVQKLAHAALVECDQKLLGHLRAQINAAPTKRSSTRLAREGRAFYSW
jgi:hypothetical protein